MKQLTDQERTALLVHLMALQDRDPVKRYAAVDALRDAVEIMDDRNLKERTHAKARADATAWIDVMGSGYAAYENTGKAIVGTEAATKGEAEAKLKMLRIPGRDAEHILAVAIVADPVPRDRLRTIPNPEPAPRVRRMRASSSD